MATIHTPELYGAYAVYTDNEHSEYVERPIIGWDEGGRPLVMCGDALRTADTAPFVTCSVYLLVRRPDLVKEIVAAVTQRVNEELGSMFWQADNINVLVRSAIRQHLREQREGSYEL